MLERLFWRAAPPPSARVTSGPCGRVARSRVFSSASARAGAVMPQALRRIHFHRGGFRRPGWQLGVTGIGRGADIGQHLTGDHGLAGLIPHTPPDIPAAGAVTSPVDLVVSTRAITSSCWTASPSATSSAGEQEPSFSLGLSRGNLDWDQFSHSCLHHFSGLRDDITHLRQAGLFEVCGHGDDGFLSGHSSGVPQFGAQRFGRTGQHFRAPAPRAGPPLPQPAGGRNVEGS